MTKSELATLINAYSGRIDCVHLSVSNSNDFKFETCSTIAVCRLFLGSLLCVSEKDI